MTAPDTSQPNRLADLENLAKPYASVALVAALLGGWFLLLVLIRHLSGALDVDESHFYGQLTPALGYQGSQPPLFNWLLIILNVFTGGHLVTAVSLLRNLLNFSAWFLMFLLVYQVSGRFRTAILGVAALVMMPQVFWQMQITLTHSVLVHTVAMVSLFALHRVLLKPTTLSYVFLGVALACGVLSKYSFLIVLLAGFAACVSLPSVRRRFSQRGLLLSAIAFAAALVPHLIWAIINATSSLERIDRVATKYDTLPDLPWLGIDGVILIGWALLVSVGPALLLWLLSVRSSIGTQATVRFIRDVVDVTSAGHRHQAQAKDQARAPVGTLAHDEETYAALFIQLLGRILGFGIAGMVVATLLGDLHRFEPRYLIPLLTPFPAWLALTLAPVLSRDASRALAVIAIGLWLALPVILAFKITSGGDRLSITYPKLATAVHEVAGDRPEALIVRRRVTAVNTWRAFDDTKPAADEASKPRQTAQADQTGQSDEPGKIVIIANARKDMAWLRTLSTLLASCGFRVAEPTPQKVVIRHGWTMPRTSTFEMIVAERPASLALQDLGKEALRCATSKEPWVVPITLRPQPL